MKLFNNPSFVKSNNTEKQQDGTFLHDDIVLKEIVRSSCSPYVYQNNREILDVVSQTLVNFAPVSINLMDYWNKNELYSVCVPNDPKVLDKIDKRKHIPEPTKGFFINSILPLQEKLSEVYMNNFFSTAFKARNSHVLRSNLGEVFKRHGLNINSTDNKRLLFNNVNALFYEPRFITNKEYNTKKGKPITFLYATKSAWEAEIEGEMTSKAFFCDYKETGTLEYEVTSVLLGDVYRAFVKPLTHPLGFGEYYSKVCKMDLTEKVLGKVITTADAVTVRWSNTSDTSPTPPPYMLLNQEPNPDYDPTIPVGEPLDPLIPGVLNPEPLRYILPYPSAIPNKEHIVETDIPDPNHPSNTLLNRVYGTWDGFNLDPMINTIDEGQGNILQDIETGYGIKEYSGYEYTKYIFKNGSYVIEYSCLQENAKFQRLVEYYRYDSFDISIHQNLINENPVLSYLYPTTGVNSNIINGRFTHLTPNPGVLTKFNGYGFEDENTAAHWPYNTYTNLGLDRGLWTPLAAGYPSAQSSYVKLTDVAVVPENIAPVAIQAFEPMIQKEDFFLVGNNPITLNISIDPSNHFINKEESISVYVNGLRKFYNTDMNLSEYSLNGQDLTINNLVGTDTVQVVQELPRTIVTRIEIDQERYDNKYISYINQGVNLNVFRDGELYDKNNYNPDEEGLNRLEFNYEAMHDLPQSLGIWEQRKVTLGDIFYVVEYPSEVKTANHRAQVEDIPSHYIPHVYPGLTEQNSIHFNIDNPYRDVIVWTNGLLRPMNTYETIRIANEWSAPRTPIDWDQNTNVINTKYRFIPTYTLISRFIEKRNAIVNAFNVQRHDSPSVVEEFKIKCIPYNRNIINTEIETRNIIHDEESIQNRHQINYN